MGEEISLSRLKIGQKQDHYRKEYIDQYEMGELAYKWKIYDTTTVKISQKCKLFVHIYKKFVRAAF